MSQKIAQISLIVKDYDEAIQFYVDKLGFLLLEDKKMTEEKRWIRIAPPGKSECSLLLAKANNEQQLAAVGNQTGGRVFLFLHTDDFWNDYNKMIENKIHFISLPRKEEYGLVAVFKDLYGNLWDFIQPMLDCESK
ncbi:MAG: VOC family protein [Niastella sp.]|nr:VOC family protein [Niastella sp.]